MGPYSSLEEIRQANQAAGGLYFPGAPVRAGGPWHFTLQREPPNRPLTYKGTVFERVYDGRYFIRSSSWQAESPSRQGQWAVEYRTFLARHSGVTLEVGVKFRSHRAAESALLEALATGRVEVALWEENTEEALLKAGISPTEYTQRVYLGDLAVGDPMSEADAIELAEEISFA